MTDVISAGHRPRIHLIPPRGWMNEPHGAVQVDGEHHVFFQHNPKEADWADICWGHATSTDLVHWRYHEVALDPATVAVAPDGVWSGSSVVGDEGELLLYFTAGDFARFPNQAVARARSVDAAHTSFTAEDRLLVEQPMTVDGRPTVAGEFRDPFVWREADEWFMLVGSGIEGAGGAALLFSSPDGVQWHSERPLYVGSTETWPKTGVMWELPVFLPIGDGSDGQPRHVLLVAPWWAGPSEHHLQYVWHWIGRWDAASRTFTPDSDEPAHFDFGGHLTGPSGTALADGRAILWTIAQDGRSREEHLETDWAHNAGFPVELSLGPDDRLRVNPVRELALLRSGDLVSLAEPSHAEVQEALGRLHGHQFEIHLLLEPGSGPAALHVRCSDSGDEETVVGVDPVAGEVFVDRSKSSRDENHRAPRRSGAIPGSLDHVDLRMIVDGSMVEAWVNSVVSITTRAYPTSPDATGLRLSLADDAHILSLAVYALGD